MNRRFTLVFTIGDHVSLEWDKPSWEVIKGWQDEWLETGVEEELIWSSDWFVVTRLQEKGRS